MQRCARYHSSKPYAAKWLLQSAAQIECQNIQVVFENQSMDCRQLVNTIPGRRRVDERQLSPKRQSAAAYQHTRVWKQKYSTRLVARHSSRSWPLRHDKANA